MERKWERGIGEVEFVGKVSRRHTRGGRELPAEDGEECGRQDGSVFGTGSQESGGSWV